MKFSASMLQFATCIPHGILLQENNEEMFIFVSKKKKRKKSDKNFINL